MKKYLYGFDIGTEGSKGIIIDLEGNVLAYDYIGHDVERPRPGWAEHDGDKVWWGEFVQISKNLLQKSGISPEEIAGISCSAITPCLLPVDEKGVPLRKAILYSIDNRCLNEANEFVEKFGNERLQKLCYATMSVQFFGPKLLWFMRHEPELFKKSAMFHTATSYVTYKITGNNVVSYDHACEFAPLYDFNNRIWDMEMCSYCGISPDQMPKLAESFDVAGVVTKEAAAVTGLAEGTPVAVGTSDFTAELMSMCGKKGDNLMIYGSTSVLLALIDKPLFSPSLFALSYPLDSLYALSGSTSTAASLTKWFKNNFGGIEMAEEEKGGISAYEALARQAAEIPVGSDGLIMLPHFAGERSPLWDGEARGMYFGLTLGHTKAHMYRALLEGVCYSVMHNLEIMTDMGVSSNRIISAGGGARNTVWTQIMSDITGKEQICLPKINGSPAGDALLAGIASGAIKDRTAFEHKLIKDTRIVEPNLDNTKKYREYYQIYKELYGRTKEQMHALSRLSGSN